MLVAGFILLRGRRPATLTGGVPVEAVGFHDHHSALQTGVEALRRLGVHPYRAERVRRDFIRTESEHSDMLFNSWRNEGEGKGFDDQYRKLFIQMQEKLLEVIRAE